MPKNCIYTKWENRGANSWHISGLTTFDYDQDYPNEKELLFLFFALFEKSGAEIGKLSKKEEATLEKKWKGGPMLRWR